MSSEDPKVGRPKPNAELQDSYDALGQISRLGWVEKPSPLQEFPTLAWELGLDWLGFKRDDQLHELEGSTKVRKLDYVLASPPLVREERWISAGALGSGHLIALTAAATTLGRRLDAHLFWEPISPAVLENLAYIASGPTDLHYHGSRVELALCRPRVLIGGALAGRGMIEPGATNGPGMAGLVRGALELALQLSEAGNAAPDRIVVPLGSGGTVAGLVVGLALAGLKTVVHAVAVVERPFATMWRVNGLVRQCRRWLATQGIEEAAFNGKLELPRVILDHSAAHPGYGVASPDSLEAVKRMADYGLPFESVYSGKAMSVLLRRPPRGERVLYWLTPHRGERLSAQEDWRDRLPPRLKRRLGSAEAALARGPLHLRG